METKGVEIIVRVGDKEFLHLHAVSIGAHRRAELDAITQQRISDAVWEASRYSQEAFRQAVRHTMGKTDEDQLPETGEE